MRVLKILVSTVYNILEDNTKRLPLDLSSTILFFWNQKEPYLEEQERGADSELEDTPTYTCDLEPLDGASCQSHSIHAQLNAVVHFCLTLNQTLII